MCLPVVIRKCPHLSSLIWSVIAARGTEMMPICAPSIIKQSIQQTCLFFCWVNYSVFTTCAQLRAGVYSDLLTKRKTWGLKLSFGVWRYSVAKTETLQSARVTVFVAHLPSVDDPSFCSVSIYLLSSSWCSATAVCDPASGREAEQNFKWRRQVVGVEAVKWSRAGSESSPPVHTSTASAALLHNQRYAAAAGIPLQVPH